MKAGDALLRALPSEALDPENPITEAKVELGARLYFDSRLSRKPRSSNGSCREGRRAPSAIIAATWSGGCLQRSG